MKAFNLKKNIRQVCYISLFFLVSFTSTVFSQDTVRVMTYNLLNYPIDYNDRNPYFQIIIENIQPDIVVVQEIYTPSGVTIFLNNVLNTSNSEFSKGQFIDGQDTDNAIFYRNTIFNFISNKRIRTSLRDINEFKLVHIPTNDTLLIYSVHLKGSQDYTQQRLSEVKALRQVTDQLPPGINFLVVGDFNIYSSSEPAYQALLDTSKPGYVLDPINKPGNWHNNFNFAKIHTQSTRLTQLTDGSGGGLDDRFDMILISQAIKDSGGITYLPGSYQAYGNDGRHFNTSVNSGSNTAVSNEVADALYYASDHLPVVCDLIFETVSTLPESGKSLPDRYALYQNYPNPFNSVTQIEYSVPKLCQVSLKVYDITGKEVATLFNGMQAAGYHKVAFNADHLTSGIYFYQLKTNEVTLVKKLVIIK